MNIYSMGIATDFKAFELNVDFSAKKSEIVNVHAISMIKNRLLAMPPGSWVLFDLDDTIWFEGVLTNDLNVDGCRLVENETPTVISDLQANGIHVLALTKRENWLNTKTMLELNKFGIVFSKIFSESMMTLKKSEKYPAIFEDGIAFTSQLNKGHILIEILKKATELGIALPPEIALIDDIHENISDIKEALEVTTEYNIPFFGVHYTAASYATPEQTESARNHMLELHRLLQKQHLNI